MEVVPRYRQNNLRPVNRIKHVFDLQVGLTLNTLSTVALVNTVDAPVIANTSEVQTGSSVNAIYLNVEAYARTEGALSNVYLAVAKNPGNNLTLPNPNVVGGSDNKKYYIHQEMKMIQQQINGNPRTIFNGVIKVPKLYKRNGPSDRLVLQIFAPGVDINFCVQCHYKEFR